jgi:transposase InsO family protein
MGVVVPRYSIYVRPDLLQLFWAGMQAGDFITDAVVPIDTSRRTGRRVLAEAGGVRPRRGRDLKGRCLTFAQREEIAVLRAQGHSPVLDLHDNRIVSVMAGPSPSVKMVTDGLRAAISNLAPNEKPLVHSDQGFQYRHTLWQDTLRGAGLTQSMSRKGTCLDNAAMEGFFSHLKEEWFRIQQPSTVEQFHTRLREYLRWWNTTRIQQRLGYLSPDEYLAQTLATA